MQQKVLTTDNQQNDVTLVSALMNTVMQDKKSSRMMRNNNNKNNNQPIINEEIDNNIMFPKLPPIKDYGMEFVSELNKLSIQERDESNYDLHGVSDIIMNEDPEFIRCSIKSMKAELDKVPDNAGKEAYQHALEQDAEYVLDEKFLIMFLRAVEFNTKTAAIRFVAFFETKLELFGREKLGRDIRVDDLDEDDINCLESGYAQVLNKRDRAGRAIFMLMPMIRRYKTLQNRMRTIYMVIMFALKDVETQKRGIVAIPYNVGPSHTKDRQAVWKNALLVSVLPIRFTGVHYCYDDEKLRAVFFVAMVVFEKAARIRSRFHLGTDMEVIYTLMTFGIPNEALPVSFSGSLRLENHHDFIRRMRKEDDESKISSSNGNVVVRRIIVPSQFDVLLGRGKPLQKYSGNINYHYVIGGYHDHYEEASKQEKTELAMTIVNKIHSRGGRFLKQDDGGWLEIPNEAARSKVSHTFRNHRIAARTAIKKEAAAYADSIIKDPPSILGGGVPFTPIPAQCSSNDSSSNDSIIHRPDKIFSGNNSNAVGKKRRKVNV